MIIAELKGNSSSNICLMMEGGLRFVRKKGNIERNLERYRALDLPFPKIINIEHDYYDIEYVKNISIRNYLTNNSPSALLTFLDNTINYLRRGCTAKDYTSVYYNKLEKISFEKFAFSKEHLINRLPKVLPSSNYFGDLTFDNILFDVNQNRFVLIDGLTSEFDSYVFDLHKLKQDVICKWFLRKEKNTNFLNHKLIQIDKHLGQYNHYQNNYLTILMLLRVYPYCKCDTDMRFIENEVNKLWM